MSESPNRAWSSTVPFFRIALWPQQTGKFLKKRRKSWDCHKETVCVYPKNIFICLYQKNCLCIRRKLYIVYEQTGLTWTLYSHIFQKKTYFTACTPVLFSHKKHPFGMDIPTMPFNLRSPTWLQRLGAFVIQNAKCPQFLSVTDLEVCLKKMATWFGEDF